MTTIHQVSRPDLLTSANGSARASVLLAIRTLLGILVFAPPLLVAVVGLLRPLASWVNVPLGVVVVVSWAAATLLWALLDVFVGKKLRFGVMKLLMATLVLGVGFGSWRAFVISPRLREQHALAAIRGVSGNVWIEPQGPRWLGELVGDYPFQRVTQFHIVAETGSEEDLVYLTEFPKLRCLFLTGEHFTDGALDHLRALQQPVQVFLTRTSIKNAALDELRRAAPNLEVVKQ